MDRRRFQAEVASPAASPPPQENVALLNRARDAISRLQADLADAQRRAATAEHALGEARTHAELAERRADGLEFSLQETRSELQGLYDSQQHQLAEVGASTASLRGRLAGLDGEMRERAAAAGSLVAERNALQEQVRASVLGAQVGLPGAEPPLLLGSSMPQTTSARDLRPRRTAHGRMPRQPELILTLHAVQSLTPRCVAGAGLRPPWKPPL